MRINTVPVTVNTANVSCYYYDDDYHSNCELAIKVWIKDLYFPARKTDKGFMKKVIFELELEGWVGLPQAENWRWYRQLLFPFL